MEKLTDSIYWLGCNDHDIDIFEGTYPMAKIGMAYNSYVVIDEKIAVMDTVDAKVGDDWLRQMDQALNGRLPDYLVIQHMEPDHSQHLTTFMDKFPKAVIVSSNQAFTMMKNLFGVDYADRRKIVTEGDVLDLGKHKLHFVTAPMVHWPEVLMTYESTDKVLFSADGFGKFGAIDHKDDWVTEARRYYIGIVGKFGPQVQNVLKKAATLDIQKIAPLHGWPLTEDLGKYLNYYIKWSSYEPEEEGVVIYYASVYGRTAAAALYLAEECKKAGIKNVVTYDLVRSDITYALSDGFRFKNMVLCSMTCNMGVSPFMSNLVHDFVAHNLQKKKVGIVENGCWTPNAAKTIKTVLAPCKDIEYLDTVTIMGAMTETNKKQLCDLAKKLK